MVEAWKKYEAGVRYNSTFKPNKDYYQAIKVWNHFYDGDQWIGLEENNLPQMVFNIIKRIINFQIASVTSSDIAVNVEPLEYTPHTQEDINELFDSDFINAEIKNIFEKWKFRVVKKDALRKAAIAGDMCAHIIFNPTKKPYRGFAPEVLGEIEIELIDATNVLFGNANIRDVEKQPYIVLVGRDTVKNLKKEAKQYSRNKSDEIKYDNDTSYQLTDFADTEVEIEGDDEGKAKFIYIYEKKEDRVYVTKCTQDTIIYKDIDTGYTNYPVAFDNWDKQENTFHGRGAVEGLCPNQIAINKMFSMVVYHQMMTAFPTAVYDADVIEDWTNEIGTAFALKNMQGRRIEDVAGYLKPANMSDYIIKVIDLAIQYTKECRGVSDASLGNIDPKNTSAIIAVQKSTAVPLENVKDNLYNFVEQIVKIMIDVIASKYGERPVVIVNEDGGRQLIKYNFSKLKDMDLHLSIDVGESSYYSQIAMIQTLDNLLQNGFIEFIDYLERIPNELFPKKGEFIAKLKEKQQEMIQVNNEAKYEQMAQFMEQLPQETQEHLKKLPPEQLEQKVLEMMGGEVA